MKQNIEKHLAKAFEARNAAQFPLAKNMPSEYHYMQQAEDLISYLQPLIQELTQREASLVESARNLLAVMDYEWPDGNFTFDDEIKELRATLKELNKEQDQ